MPPCVSPSLNLSPHPGRGGRGYSVQQTVQGLGASCAIFSISEMPVFRKFPEFRKFCKKFLDFRNLVLYKRIGKCTSSTIFSEFQEIYTKMTGISGI